MNCPVCKDVNLVMSDREGIEIDYCPSCRGVWLDRGELDKIIERSTLSSNQSHYSQRNSYQQNSYKDSSKYKKQDGYYKKRKESIFSELFDF